MQNNKIRYIDILVTSIKDIPNFKQRLKDGKITYRGLGFGKLHNDFYKLTGTGGTRIKVDGKEYFITQEEFDKFSRDKDGRLIVRFDAPKRKFEHGGKADGVEQQETNQILNQLMDEYDLPAEVIEEYASQMGIEIVDITDLPFNGRHDSEEDFAEDWVEQCVVTNLSIYLEMTRLDMRLFAQKEADSRVDNMDDDDILDEIDLKNQANEHNELEREIEDLENDIDDLKSELDDYLDEEDEEITESDIQMRDNKSKELRDDIEEKESNLNTLQHELSELATYDEVLDKAKEELRDIYYDDIYSELEIDAVGYFVDNLGYSEQDLIKNSFFSVNLERLASDLSHKFIFIHYDGDLYVFSAFMDGGMLSKGGETNFKDKVNAIKKRLQGMSVDPKYRNEYGKTYDKKEAEYAAKKIAGAIRAKGIAKNKYNK